MPRAPNEKVQQAYELYRRGMKLVEIAERLGVPAGTVRRWKNTYRWESERSEQKASVRNMTLPEVQDALENSELTDKQRLFCLYYVKSFNATRSYQKAYGCSYETALTNGPALLGNTRIQTEIQRLKELRLSQAFLSEKDIFQKHVDIAFSDITDYVTFGQEEVPVMGAFGPIEVTDPESGEKVPLTQMVNVVRARGSDEVDGSLITEISQGKSGFKIKLLDKGKSLEWLGRKLDPAAAEERQARIDHTKASTAKIRGEDPSAEVEDDGFLEALRGKAADVWDKE